MQRPFKARLKWWWFERRLALAAVLLAAAAAAAPAGSAQRVWLQLARDRWGERL